VPLAGRPMVEWSIAAFRGAGVAAIVVAVPPGHAYEPASLFLSSAMRAEGTAEADPAPPEARVVEGGATRSVSVSNAMKAVKTDLVAIHDAARPLLTPELAAGVIATLTADPEAAGAIAAAPLTDTVKRSADLIPEPSSRPLTPSEGANRRLVVGGTLDRTALWAAQTPQVFRVEALRAALSGDPQAVAAATDEAMLVEAAGGRVLIHPVETENLKVTTPLDFRVADSLLAERTSR
jgi:2-C-methyl-D-erythritol 4-phosphate cytidylyltransferase